MSQESRHNEFITFLATLYEPKVGFPDGMEEKLEERGFSILDLVTYMKNWIPHDLPEPKDKEDAREQLKALLKISDDLDDNFTYED